MSAPEPTFQPQPNPEAQQRVLTFRGQTEVPVGYLMGPDLLGRVWMVLSTEYDENTDRTRVTVELPTTPKEPTT